MIDIDSINTQWLNDEPKLKSLGEKIFYFLKQQLLQLEINAEISYRTKEIQSIIKKIIRKQKEKQYTYDDLKDKLGVRIICPFLSDLEIVDVLLGNNFNIRKKEIKQDAINFDKLDYQSNHYDVSVKKENVDFDENFVFEIQVRTLNQHAWANSAHILYYKQDVELPNEMKRKIYRLLSLYELADEEFAKVNQFLKNQKNNLEYTLLRKLEGKIYKYAQTDFDRKLSIENVKSILDFLSPNEKQQIEDFVEEFIQENDTKIKHIFSHNQHRFAKMPLLTQPEIFIIWFGLAKFEFSISDNWNDNFDSNDLDLIKNLWC